MSRTSSWVSLLRLTRKSVRVRLSLRRMRLTSRELETSSLSSHCSESWIKSGRIARNTVPIKLQRFTKLSKQASNLRVEIHLHQKSSNRRTIPWKRRKIRHLTILLNINRRLTSPRANLKLILPATLQSISWASNNLSNQSNHLSNLLSRLPHSSHLCNHRLSTTPTQHLFKCHKCPSYSRLLSRSIHLHQEDLHSITKTAKTRRKSSEM